MPNDFTSEYAAERAACIGGRVDLERSVTDMEQLIRRDPLRFGAFSALVPGMLTAATDPVGRDHAKVLLQYQIVDGSPFFLGADRAQSDIGGFWDFA